MQLTARSSVWALPGQQLSQMRHKERCSGQDREGPCQSLLVPLRQQENQERSLVKVHIKLREGILGVEEYEKSRGGGKQWGSMRTDQERGGEDGRGCCWILSPFLCQKASHELFESLPVIELVTDLSRHTGTMRRSQAGALKDTAAVVLALLYWAMLTQHRIGPLVFSY